MQRRLVDETRLGIPAIAHEECLTGFTTSARPIYPAPLRLGRDLRPRPRRADGRGASARPARRRRPPGPRRPSSTSCATTAGAASRRPSARTPTSSATIGTAYVRASSRRGSSPRSSTSSATRPRARPATTRRSAWAAASSLDVMLPPFEMAVREGRAGSVMNSYTDIDGVPVAADPWLLTEVLRDEMGFARHGGLRLLRDQPPADRAPGRREPASEAGALALQAGIDVELPATHCFGDDFVELVEAGAIPIDIVDRRRAPSASAEARPGAARRGLRPCCGRRPRADLDSPANRGLSRRAAEESVVLLKNSGLLPLTGYPPRSR